jgi:exodeoxyribonuclease VII small subunit
MSSQPANEESPQQPGFEQSLAELESIVHALEDGRLGLDDSLSRYERGIGLLKHCHQLLERAERRIELLCGVDAEGNPVTQPFDEGAETTLEEKSATRSRRRSAPKGSKGAAGPSAKPTGGADDIDEPAGLF